MSPDELAAWVTRSRDAQGLPVKVRDPAVLRTVVVLVTGGSSARSRKLAVLEDEAS